MLDFDALTHSSPTTWSVAAVNELLSKAEAYDALQVEVETLRKRLHDAQACMADIIDFDGFSHDDPDCPENADECRCANAAKVNAAMEGYVPEEKPCRTAGG
jgi:nicotinate-nucleotide pyrophosphorylase